MRDELPRWLPSAETIFFGPELAETYRLAVRKGRITARDVLVIAPEVGISAASNRLAKLQAMGLLMRTREAAPESGGRQFAYEAAR